MCLLLSSQAIKIKKDEINFDYDENVQTSEDEFNKEKQFNKLIETNKKINSDNKDLIKNYNQKMAQAQRNVDQGLFGRSLANSKLVEIKTDMNQIVENFKLDRSLFPALI